MLRYCETKQFWRKILIHYLLSMKFFHTKMFVEHRSVLLWNVSVLWDNKILIENRHRRSLPSYPWSFSIPDLIWHKEGFLYGKICYSDSKKFRRKVVIAEPAPLILEVVRYQKFFATQKGCATFFLSVVEKTNVRRNFVILHPLLLSK